MNSDFSRAMARATDRVRAQDLAAATAAIQAALGLDLGLGPQPEPAADPAPRRNFRVMPDVEDAETVEERPGEARSPVARRSLRDVVGLLRSGRAAFDGLPLPGSLPRPQAPALPEGARFEWRTHACPAGSRRYRLFIPSCPRSELRGLVLMLHGCKQDPDDFAAGTGMNQRAEAERVLVAYPEQPMAANVSGCWNWFDPAHQGRGSGEPAVLAALARDLAAEFALPAGRVFAAGLSAGGAMAAVLAETHPELFAAVGIHSGLPFGSARDVASAFASMRGQGIALPPRRAADGPRAIVFHGTADATVHPRNAEAIASGFRETGHAGAPPETGTTAGRGWRRTRVQGADAVPRLELWLVEGAGHAWSGGDRSGSYADPTGPSASAEMLRFFLAAAG